MPSGIFKKYICCPECKGQGFEVVDHDLTKECCCLCEGGGSLEVDELHERAIESLTKISTISISSLQRKLRIGFNRAFYIMEDLEKLRIVSKPNAQGRRELLINIESKKEQLFTQEELEADFEMAVDMMELGLQNKNNEDFDLLSEFKSSDYSSAKRLK